MKVELVKGETVRPIEDEIASLGVTVDHLRCLLMDVTCRLEAVRQLAQERRQL